MITVYQIRLIDREIAEAVYRQMASSGYSAWKNEYAQYYTPVMEIETDDLDDAFDAANGYSDSVVRRLSRGHSGSVGDIFVKDGDCYIVDPMGFTNIGRYELGAE
jgi:hypothetical protein